MTIDALILIVRMIVARTSNYPFSLLHLFVFIFLSGKVQSKHLFLNMVDHAVRRLQFFFKN